MDHRGRGPGPPPLGAVPAGAASGRRGCGAVGLSPAGRPAAWAVERPVATAAGLHALGIPAVPGRVVRVCRPTRPALVLGSAQPLADVDRAVAAAAGVEVVRRRSGGGAVLVVPGALAWVDVVVPAGDPLWCDDVGRAMEWLGEAWVRALASLGVAAAVHRGGLVRTAWSARVCFAGLGQGEVVAAGAGAGGLVGRRKVVGISQRRTRAAALLQSAALLTWDPAGLLALLDLPAGERRAGEAALAGAAAGVREAGAPGVEVGDLDDALLSALP